MFRGCSGASVEYPRVLETSPRGMLKGTLLPFIKKRGEPCQHPALEHVPLAVRKDGFGGSTLRDTGVHFEYPFPLLPADLDLTGGAVKRGGSTLNTRPRLRTEGSSPKPKVAGMMTTSFSPAFTRCAIAQSTAA